MPLQHTLSDSAPHHTQHDDGPSLQTTCDDDGVESQNTPMTTKESHLGVFETEGSLIIPILRFPKRTFKDEIIITATLTFLSMGAGEKGLLKVEQKIPLPVPIDENQDGYNPQWYQIVFQPPSEMDGNGDGLSPQTTMMPNSTNTDSYIKEYQVRVLEDDTRLMIPCLKFPESLRGKITATFTLLSERSGEGEKKDFEEKITFPAPFNEENNSGSESRWCQISFK